MTDKLKKSNSKNGISRESDGSTESDPEPRPNPISPWRCDGPPLPPPEMPPPLPAQEPPVVSESEASSGPRRAPVARTDFVLLKTAGEQVDSYHIITCCTATCAFCVIVAVVIATPYSVHTNAAA